MHSILMNRTLQLKQNQVTYLAALIQVLNKQHSQYDLLDDMGIFPRSNDEEGLVIKRTNDNDYRQLLHLLNKKQKEFFYHVLHY